MRKLVYDVRRYYHTVAPFLEAELANRGDEDFWRRVAREHAGGSILELGCGTGRITALLATGGARVVGIDICPELLHMARKRLAGFRPAGGQDARSIHSAVNARDSALSARRPALILADMRQPPFGGQFEAIVAPDDPFSHLLHSDDRDRALAAAARNLARDGRFILDALWFRPGDERLALGPGLVLRHQAVVSGAGLGVRERWRCNSRSHCCSADFQYDRRGRAPTHARFRARYWTTAELQRRLHAAGLAISALWGDYDGHPWDEQRSEHLVVEARAA
jgi:SAM-dependent methyltransferase